MRAIVWMLLVFSVALFAQDEMCRDFCKKCEGESSEVCSSIEQNCNCSASSPETEYEIESSSDSSEPEPVAKSEPESLDKKPANKSGPLVNVDFGAKGDDETTAVLKKDGSYELQSKNHAGIVFSVILGVALVVVLVFTIAQ